MLDAWTNVCVFWSVTNHSTIYCNMHISLTVFETIMFQIVSLVFDYWSILAYGLALDCWCQSIVFLRERQCNYYLLSVNTFQDYCLYRIDWSWKVQKWTNYHTIDEKHHCTGNLLLLKLLIEMYNKGRYICKHCHS